MAPKPRSRQTTPQPTPAGRGRRSTTSRSPQAVRRSSRQQGQNETPVVSPRKVAGGTSSAESPKRPTRATATLRQRGGRQQGEKGKRLSAVLEGHESGDQQQVSSPGSDDEDQFEDAAMRQESRSSVITSNSVVAVNEISQVAHQLPALLPAVDANASAILAILVPPALHTLSKSAAAVSIKTNADRINQPTSGTAKHFQDLEEIFDESIEKFGGDHFIRPDYVLRGLFGKGSPKLDEDGLWRPDEILQKANLAKLAIAMVRYQPDEDHALATIQQLDDLFPQLFLTGFAAGTDQNSQTPTGSSALLGVTYKTALDIRTHKTINELQSEEDDHSFDPDIVLSSVFLDENQIKDWNGFFSSAKENLITERMNDIRKHFKTREPGERGTFFNLDKLKQAFPRARLQQEIMVWISLRMNELDELIAARGGASLIRQRLLQEMGMPSAARKRVKNLGRSAGMLKERAMKSTGVSIIDMTAGDAGPGSAKKRLNVGAEQPETANLSEDGDEDIPPRRRSGREAAAGSSQQNATQDIGFQSDRRANNAEERRAQAKAIEARGQLNKRRRQLEGEEPPAKRTRQAGPADAGPAEEDAQGDGDPDYVPGADDGDGEEEPGPQSSSAMSYEAVQAAARQQGRILLEQQKRARPRQKREPWSLLEVEALIDYIGRYGCSWTYLKERDKNGHDNVLELRSQGDLKDKAKNMKYDYLKAEAPLPTGFEHVMLDVKFKQRLEALKIPYDQEQVRRTRN